jgi:2'-5' RNA ligase
VRLFVSVDLPDRLTDAVADLQATFEGASGLRFTDPGRAHLTLKFLGETDPDRVEAVVAALDRSVADAGVDPFAVEYGGLGVFPSREYVSVVWLGVRAGTEQLTRLHEAVESETTALGFDPEDHEFTPHVTLARMDHAGGKELVLDRLEDMDPRVGSHRVESIALTESRLTADGPEYATVERVEL